MYMKCTVNMDLHRSCHCVYTFKRCYSFEMWIWRRMEKISWKDKVRNEQVLEIVKEKRTLISL